MEPLSNRFSSANTNKQTQYKDKHELQIHIQLQMPPSSLRLSLTNQVEITSSNYSTRLKLKSNHISGDFGRKAYSDHPSIWIPQHPILPQSKQLDRKVIFFISVAHMSNLVPRLKFITSCPPQEASYVTFDLSVPRGTSFGLYARRNALPTHTHYDFMEVILCISICICICIWVVCI